MKRLMQVLVTMLLSLLIAPGLASAVSIKQAASLTPTGDRAIQDLRRCLAANDNLDVFYLMDNSGSLYDTDPSKIRADVMGESLRQLAALSQDPTNLSVNWNLGFFADDFFPAVDRWLEVDPQEIDEWPDRLAKYVNETGPGGGTNWLEGILGAQRELAMQKKVSGGCQVMIWLTDGGLNVLDDNQASEAAMNALCGQVAIPGASKPNLGLGPLYELRQSGVSVFGVLLDVVGGGVKDKYQDRKSWIAPLVESAGTISLGSANANVACGDGTGKIPSTHAAGAFIRAQSPADLSVQFLKLSGAIRGGSTSTINPDGTFAINPGVAAVSIISLEQASNLSLTDPSGANALGQAGVSLEENAGATSLNIEVDSTSDFGTWRVLGTEPSETVLIAFSALSVEPSSDNALITGTTSDIKLNATVIDQSLFALSDYSFNYRLYQVGRDGQVIELAVGTQSDFSNGSLTVPVTPEANASEVKLRYEIENLKTVVGGTELAPISSEQSLLVSLPDNFPTFGPIPLDLGVLSGRLEPTTGLLEVKAPASGESGFFCLPQGSDVKILSDSVDRSSTWDWKFTTTLTAGDDGCYFIGPGETATVEVSVANSTTANSQVSAEALITLKDSTGSKLDVALPIQFASERVINPFVYGLLTAILTLLSLLLPLLVMYLINKATVKFEHGNELLKAVFPAQYDVSTEQVMGRNGFNLKSGEIGLEEFKFQPPKKDASSFDLTDSLTAVAMVSPNPLKTPWFEVRAKEGYRVFTKSTRKGKLFTSGQRAEFSGQLSKLSAVVVKDSDLKSLSASTTDLPATLVVFDRNAGGANPNFQERMVNVVNDTKLRANLVAARDLALAAEQSKSKKVKPAKVTTQKPQPPKPNLPTGPGGPSQSFSAPGKPSNAPPAAPAGNGPTGPAAPQSGPPTAPKPPSNQPPTL